jgi:hypothetical protein
MTRSARTGFGNCAAVLLVVFALASCRPLFHRQVSGVVLAVQGVARAKANGQTFRLTTESHIFPETTIELPAKSQLDLMLLPGILVELAGESEIEITELLLSRDGDETIRPMKSREATLRLTRGTLCISVGRAPTGSRLRVITPAGTVIAGSGRACKVTVRGEKARIVSIEAEASFAPADGSARIKVGPGFSLAWPGATRVPEAAAEAGPDGQEELAKASQDDVRLLSLATEHEGFIPWERGNASRAPK